MKLLSDIGTNNDFVICLQEYSFATASRPALGLTQPSVLWVPGREADHSTPSRDIIPLTRIQYTHGLVYN